MASTESASPEATPVASVLAERISRPAVAAASTPGGTLPFTGGAVGTLLAAGISLLVLGGLAWLSVRWKSRQT